MSKIIRLTKATTISQKLRGAGKTIVLVGGCFDILHLGHIKFLEEAKKADGILFIALESDHNVRRRKGGARPINSQKDRAKILAALKHVDFVILLPDMRGFDNYFEMVETINPHFIAVTEGDYHFDLKKRQAEKIGAQILVVTPVLRTKSTTKIAQLLEKEI
ncbi:adenylyltransferase/cytidyltransferase family protein [Candidatus Microgenomates bacterium]|nr:adenylyltransferase/cytidyltransferase family protein [Candidatus Microgenomates bacterium]